MSDTLSHKRQTVKKSPNNPNPRPTRPQPTFAETRRRAQCDPVALKNPRPAQLPPSLRELCDPNAHEPEATATTAPAGDFCDGSDENRRPPGIAKLQGWIGVRSGVSPKLRGICGSGDEALILNQLVCYWFARDKRNRIRARITKSRSRWVAKSHKEWSDELGMTPKQVRRSIAALAKDGFVECRTWRFYGKNTTHLRPLVSNIAMATGCPDDQVPYRRASREGGMHLSPEEREIIQNTRTMEIIGRYYR